MKWFILLLILLSCDTSSNDKKTVANTPPSVENNQDGESFLNNDIVIPFGETVYGQNLSIQFQNVRSDNRCPTGVSCFWEGDAEIVLNVQLNGEQRALAFHSNRRFEFEHTIDAYVIRLKTVDPYPKKSGTIEDDDYSVTLVVTKK